MIKPLLAVALFASFVGLVACGNDPGGTVGDACTETGSAAECGDGELCGGLSGFDSEAYCLKICTTDDDCDAGEKCSGTSGGSGQTCQPDDDATDDNGGGGGK